MFIVHFDVFDKSLNYAMFDWAYVCLSSSLLTFKCSNQSPTNIPFPKRMVLRGINLDVIELNYEHLLPPKKESFIFLWISSRFNDFSRINYFGIDKLLLCYYNGQGN